LLFFSLGFGYGGNGWDIIPVWLFCFVFDLLLAFEIGVFGRIGIGIRDRDKGMGYGWEWVGWLLKLRIGKGMN
jgi:hypothetical protein